MAGKPRAATARAAARSKTAVPATTRTTRGAAKIELEVERSNHKAESRKPLLNRENSPDAKLVDHHGKATKIAASKHTAASRANNFRDTETDMDREPVKVGVL